MKTFNVGDILSASYLYSSRHNHFFIVTKRTPHTMKVQRVYAQTTSDDGYGQNGMETVLVEDGQPIAFTSHQPTTHRIKLDEFGNEKAKYQDYYSSFSKWQGEALPFYTD